MDATEASQYQTCVTYLTYKLQTCTVIVLCHPSFHNVMLFSSNVFIHWLLIDSWLLTDYWLRSLTADYLFSCQGTCSFTTTNIVYEVTHCQTALSVAMVNRCRTEHWKMGTNRGRKSAPILLNHRPKYIHALAKNDVKSSSHPSGKISLKNLEKITNLKYNKEFIIQH